MSPKGRLPETDSAPPPRIDRRRRHSADPTVPITVNIPVALRTALDAVVAERNATRSGLIVMALRAWLEREEARETAGTAPEA
jgi:hypothetical protein